ncbi:MAG: hypothetical protein PHO32_02470 [Candidatus Cloacimonetes bacterium]|nr:hypothetical protein [Candidatus Cloacimonadota bacterium]
MKKYTIEKKLDELLPKMHSLDKHILRSCDVLTKELYLSLLTAIAFEDKEISVKEANYLKALCLGVGDLDFEKLISQIVNIDERLEDILKSIQHEQLELWFFLDALIASMIDQQISQKEADLLGRLADALKLSRKEVITCLKLATVILSQDEKMLLDLLAEVPEAFPIYALHEAYNSQWFEARLSFTEDLANGIQLKGKYLIQKPITLSGEHDLNDLDLVFSGGGNLTIEKGAKIKISKSSFRQTEITCAENSTLTLNSCSLSGGKGFYVGLAASYVANHCSFDNLGISSDKATSILLEDVKFENVKGKRAMSLTNCMNVTIISSKFISCGYNLNGAEKEEGGAILMRDCAILIDKCHFEDCTASGDGGALSFWKSSYGIKDSKFVKCRSGCNGGSMVVHDTISAKGNKSYPCYDLVIDGSRGSDLPICKDTEFLSCYATESGGGFFDYDRYIRFEKCLFKNCSAIKNGGAGVYLGETNTEYISSYYVSGKAGCNRILRCTFNDNKAKEGSGLWMKKLNCYQHEDDFYGKYNDIHSSIFHNCDINHTHDAKLSGNAGNCLLANSNTFTSDDLSNQRVPSRI